MSKPVGPLHVPFSKYTQRDPAEVNVRISNPYSEIAENGFAGWQGNSVTIDSHLFKKIGKSAFSGCPNFTALLIINENVVEDIDDYAFNDCQVLKSIPTFTHNLKHLGLGAFRNCCDLESVDLSQTQLVQLQPQTFVNCNRMRTFQPPPQCTSVMDYVFRSCGALRQIPKFQSNCKFGLGVYIGCNSLFHVQCKPEKEMFQFCEDLRSATITGDIGPNAFDGCGKLQTLVVTAAQSFGKSAFRKCLGLLKQDIQSSVTTFDDYCFEGCYNMTSIIIRAKKATFGKVVFSKCSKLTAIYYDGSASDIGGLTKTQKVYRITEPTDYFVYNQNTAKYLVDGCLDITPENTQKIGDGSVYTSIKDLSGCKNILKSIKMGKDMQLFYTSAFRDCSVLTSITIPDQVTIIPLECFYGCTSLKEVIFSKTTSYVIGDYAFCNCVSLTKLTNCPQFQAVPAHCFYGCAAFDCAPILQQKGIYPGFCSFAGSGVRMIDATDYLAIGTQAFSSCLNLREVHIPKNILVEKQAFEQLPELQKFEIWCCIDWTDIIESSKYPLVTLLGNGQCYSVPKCYWGDTTITIPNNFSSISSTGFANVTSVQKIILPTTIVSLSDNCFINLPSLTQINLDGIQRIGSYALSNTGITELVTSVKLLQLFPYAIYGCKKLTSITINSNAEMKQSCLAIGSTQQLAVSLWYEIQDQLSRLSPPQIYTWLGLTVEPTWIGQGTTYTPSLNDKKATKVIIGEQYISIIDGAFDCVNPNQYPGVLRQINIPTKINSFPKRCFYGQTDLMYVTGTTPIQLVDDEAFYGCRKLAHITFDPALVPALGARSFAGAQINNVTLTLKGQSIGDGCFKGSTGIQRLIVDHVMQFGKDCFADCPSIGLNKGDIQIHPNMLTDKEANAKFWGFTDAQIANMIPWGGMYDPKNFGDDLKANVVIPPQYTYIVNNAFANNTILQSIDLGNVTTIPKYCFRSCTNLKYVTGLQKLKVINESGFDFCTAMEFDSSVFKELQIIWHNAFQGTNWKDNVWTLPPKVKEIYKGIITNSTVKYLQVYPGTGVRQIFAEEGVFSNCRQLVGHLEGQTVVQTIPIWRTLLDTYATGWEEDRRMLQYFGFTEAQCQLVVGITQPLRVPILTPVGWL